MKNRNEIGREKGKQEGNWKKGKQGGNWNEEGKAPLLSAADPQLNLERLSLLKWERS